MAMMMKNREIKEDKIVYTTSPGIRPNIYRGIALIVIFVCVIYIQVNTTFFSIIIAFATIIGLIIDSYNIKVKEREFCIYKNNGFTFLFPKKYCFEYSQISNFDFQDSELTWEVHHFPPLPNPTGKTLEIFFKDGSEETFEGVYLRWDDLDECRALINARIQE